MIAKITNIFKKKLLILVVGILIVGGAGLVVWSNRNASVQAVWFDDNFAYRQTVTVTNNGSAQTAYQHQVVLGTGDLVVAGKMQSDCDDVRFTDASGKVISHWNEYCFSASGKNSSFWLYFDALPAGTTTVYVYYGNPTATTASRYKSNPTGINVGTGNDGSITVASNSNINTTTIISGRSCADGGDGVNYSVTENRAAGTNQIVLSSTPASGCLAAGDEVVIMNLQGTTGDNSNVGKFEFARINSISVATLTLNHVLTNGYDGSTQKIMVQRVPNYGSVTVNSSVTFTAAAWNGTKGGVLMFRSNGTVTVSSSALLDVNSLGYRGGAGGVSDAGGANGESYDGSVGSGGARSTQGTSGGGSGDQSNTTSTGTRSGGGGGGEGGLTGQVDNDASGGGGGGGFGSGGGGGGGGGSGAGLVGGNGGAASSTTGTNAGGGGGGGGGPTSIGGHGGAGNTAGTNASGTGGAAGSGAVSGGGGGGGSACTTCSGGGGGGGGYHGVVALTALFLGGGGGGAGGNNTSGATGGAGGQAGGIVYVGATTLTNSGTIRSNGAAASAAAASVGGGGAGAGGSVYIEAQTATLGSSTVTTTGGALTNGADRGAGGGSGGVGRIAVNYSTSTGSTSPTATTSTLPVSGASANEEKSPGPIGYWKFDEGTGTNAQDSTQNNNDGTISGAAWQSRDLCLSEKCLFFDGSNDRVSFGDVLDMSGDFMVGAWIRNTGNSGARQGIISKGSTSTNLEFMLRIESTDAVDFAVFNTADGGYLQCTGTQAYAADNKWHHVVGVVLGTTLTVYVDGNRECYDVVTSGTRETDTTQPLVVGARSDGTLNPFKGFIDDVKIYEYARSADQIKLDYNSKMAATAKGAGTVLGAGNNAALNNGLVGYWKLDETSGNAVDSSGNALTLTNNGTTTYVGGKFGNGSEHVPASLQYLSTATTISGVKSVSFWTNPDSTTNYFISLTSGASVTATSGVLSATGFTSPKIYVNGVAGTTIVADSWQLVTVSTETGIDANQFYVGRQDTNYYDGTLDEVRTYNRVLSPAEVSQLYNFAPGPVGYWKMDEHGGTTVTDLSGNAYNSTAFAGNAAWGTGKFGSGLTFDGSGDRVTISDQDAFSILTTNQLTVMEWVKYNSFTGTNQGPISKGSAGQYEWMLGDGASAAPQVAIYTAAGSNYFLVNSSVNITAGDWHHLAFTIDNSIPKIYLYVDGRLAGSSVTSSGSIANGTAALTFGQRADSARDYGGGLDEVKIYNYARTQKQIIEDMNAGHPAGGSPVGSAANYWKFDQGQGTVANDSGTGRNNGTLNSMASPASVGISGWNPNGRFNKSISFDGSDDDVSFGDLAWTEGISTISGTFWVKPITVAATKCLVCKYNGLAATQRSWAIETGTTNASAVRVTIPTSTTEADGTTFGETPTGQLSASVWSHVAVIYDGGQVGNVNRLKIYINGVKQNVAYTGTIPSATQATTSNATAGQASDAARNFTGDLDEIKIYAGGLTEAEIKVDYNRSQAVNFGVLGTSAADGKTASNSAATAYCVPGDTSSCSVPQYEWLFEEHGGTTANSTGTQVQAGTLTGGPIWAPGAKGTGVKLDGSDDHVTVGSSALITVTGSYTISAWVKQTVATGNQEIFGISHSDDTTETFRFYLGTGTLGYSITNDADETIIAAYPSALALNQWYHVALTKTGTSYVLYVNGVGSASTNSTSGAYTFDTSTIGAVRRLTTIEYFNGTIDQVRIWNSALSGAQIAYDYNRGLPISWWKMEQCQGATLNDSIGTASATVTIGATDQASVGTCTANANTFWYNGRSGKYNYSGNFDGDDDYAATGNLAMIIANGSTSTNVSWGGWFKPATAVASKTLLHKTNEFRLTTDSSSRPQCEIYSGSWQTAATGHTALPLGSWSHVLCTYDGSFIRTYVNGLQVGYTAETDSLTGTANAFNIARDSASSYYEGQIDEAKLWNYPLTAYQVKIDYSQGSAVRFGPLTGAP